MTVKILGTNMTTLSEMQSKKQAPYTTLTLIVDSQRTEHVKQQREMKCQPT